MTTINGLLDRGKMFVLSGAHFEAMLDFGAAAEGQPRRRLLDIGAGDGGVTAKLARLVPPAGVHVTETSPTMRYRLWRRGYTCLGVEGWGRSHLPPGERYDIISCLNVLDRCDEPITLLAQMRDSLVPVSGRLLLALVLPFAPFVEEGARRRMPSEHIQLRGRTPEENINELQRDILAPLGLEIVSLARTPYLCEGDAIEPYYLLHDYVLCLASDGSAPMPVGAWPRRTQPGDRSD